MMPLPAAGYGVSKRKPTTLLAEALTCLDDGATESKTPRHFPPDTFSERIAASFGLQRRDLLLSGSALKINTACATMLPAEDMASSIHDTTTTQTTHRLTSKSSPTHLSEGSPESERALEVELSLNSRPLEPLQHHLEQLELTCLDPRPLDPLLTRYVKINLIGEGSYSQVWKAQEAASGAFVAFKQKVVHKPGQCHLLQREVSILRLLDHPGIPKVIEYSFTPT
jgi:hypothetical protein